MSYWPTVDRHQLVGFALDGKSEPTTLFLLGVGSKGSGQHEDPHPHRSAGTILRMTPVSPKWELWACPKCGRTFANRNQSHTCAPLGDLDRHFANSQASVRATFDRLLAVLADVGPVSVLSEKTRIALHVRMSFAAIMPRRDWLNGHLVLARRIDSPRFGRIEVYSPRNVLHAFRLDSPEQVDDEFSSWLTEAYGVAEQRHLQAPS